jgi:hypothetical protein
MSFRKGQIVRFARIVERGWDEEGLRDARLWVGRVGVVADLYPASGYEAQLVEVRGINPDPENVFTAEEGEFDTAPTRDWTAQRMLDDLGR